MRKISKISIVLLCLILCTCSLFDSPTKSKTKTYYFVVESDHSLSSIVYQRPDDITRQEETSILMYAGRNWEKEFTGSKGDSITIGATSISLSVDVKVNICNEYKEILKTKQNAGTVLFKTVL